jgi:hypothetical protein
MNFSSRKAVTARATELMELNYNSRGNSCRSTELRNTAIGVNAPAITSW